MGDPDSTSRCRTPPISRKLHCRKHCILSTQPKRPVTGPEAQQPRHGGGRTMPIKILMPALSPTMTEGTLAKWLVSEGDEVNSGDVIAEIETDKATMEIEAVEEGLVGKLLVGEGFEVHVQECLINSE